MRVLPLIAVTFAAQAVAACSVWHKFMDNDEPVKTTDDVVAEAEAAEKPEKAAKAVKPSQKDEQELKIARLWARVDELEEQSLRNKERIRVVEKGITLGLVPEELKGQGQKKKKDEPIVKEPLYDEQAPPKPAAKAPEKTEAKAPAAEPLMDKEQADRYQAALASAHELYRSGRYGRAIVEYDKIGKDFAGKTDGGMHKYWIGKCWSNLKEYSTARQIFVDFISENAGSAWIPRAKLELARVEWKVGMQDTALTRYKEIIQAYPYEDAAEMAKMELENLGKTL